MDNLFNFVLFTIDSQNCKTKVMTQGVIQKSNQGVPPFVIQEDKKGKPADAAWGSAKTEVLRGDPHAKNNIVTSI